MIGPGVAQVIVGIVANSQRVSRMSNDNFRGFVVRSGERDDRRPKGVRMVSPHL
jgi:hypothetical protein